MGRFFVQQDHNVYQVWEQLKPSEPEQSTDSYRIVECWLLSSNAERAAARLNNEAGTAPATQSEMPMKDNRHP